MKLLSVTTTIATTMLAIACGSNNETKETTTASTSTVVDLSSNPDYQKGLELISKSDCLTCHKIEEKLTGPAYKEIAQKYAGSDTAVAYLSKKIISGGSGVWGSIPMTPHPQVSQADAEAMAKYVLLLK
ncbi:MAG: c-type cytochrome [Chitinophagaceae bacterium]